MLLPDAAVGRSSPAWISARNTVAPAAAVAQLTITSGFCAAMCAICAVMPTSAGLKYSSATSFMSWNCGSLTSALIALSASWPEASVVVMSATRFQPLAWKKRKSAFCWSREAICEVNS